MGTVLEGGADMTQEEKRIKIAGACGWTAHPKDRFIVIPPNSPHSVQPLSTIPDYFGDLNACHEMEECLEDDRPKYRKTLDRLTNHILCTDNLEEINWRLIHIKPEHRAEAFGLTMGLWKEGE